MTRIAIVHDFLTQRGGAERVVLRMAKLYPEAPIYTSLYDPAATYPDFADHCVITSRLQNTVAPDSFRHAALRYPAAFRSFDLSKVDLVLVSSSGFAHHVSHPRAVVYCHTPPRFLWNLEAYAPVPAVWAARPALAWLRCRDQRAARGQPVYVANSQATRERVQTAYGIESSVLHPPLWTTHLPLATSPLPSSPRALVVSRLLRYKRVDVAIAACRVVGVPLTVVGTGPDAARLRALASGDVSFVGAVTDDELAAMFAGHSVVLSPGVEDFGYVPVEAGYAGRPVIAAREGGALETVADEVTGRLVEGIEVQRWADVLREVLVREWDPPSLRAATAAFWPERFDQGMRDIVARFELDENGAGCSRSGER